jgi:anthranilate synthase component 1
VRAAAIYDHARGETWLAGEAGAEAELEALERALGERRPEAPLPPLPALALTEEDPERYLHAVRRALEYIAAGDIYQANLAREWRTMLPAGLTAAALYARLRRSNPGPFAGIAALPGMTVLSTSPERLVAVRGGVVETRPIAGTRPRHGDDAATVSELRANAKEQAEHVMLLDLERNDLGRISVGGSVVVDEYMTVESYAHVHHIVSNVRGRLRAEVTPGAVVRAVFPGGTITGCPKVRCMEIIAELEATPRGAYTGSFGYLGRDGSLDLNILIRTATVRALDRALSLRAGAGIVADSDPGRELEETRAKARGLLRALVAGER